MPKGVETRRKTKINGAKKKGGREKGTFHFLAHDQKMIGAYIP